jgi:energy-coupling factor transporter ATP-binding protein EcfA2
MTSFETIADLFATPRTGGLSTGLPQLDRIAPLGPGHLAVLIGASGVGKSRVAGHIADTVHSTHERGVLMVTEPTSIDELDASVARRAPALVTVDPLTALLDVDSPLAGPARAAADPASGLVAPASVSSRGCRGQSSIGGHREDPTRALLDQDPVHPAELGRIAEQLRDLAGRHHVPIVVCHRYMPHRDSVTSQIVSTEAVNPLLDQADVVGVVRVLADPQQVGLEMLRNRLGPIAKLRLPLPLPADGTHDEASGGTLTASRDRVNDDHSLAEPASSPRILSAGS